MKICLLIATHKRLQITDFCFSALHQLRQRGEELGADIQPVIICSSSEHEKLAQSHYFDYYRTENKPLGRKMNKGLSYAMESDWDYLLQLGSDDILSFEGLDKIIKAIGEGVQWGGFNELFVGHINREVVFHVATTLVYGAGRFIHRRLLKMAGDSVRVQATATVAGTNFMYSKGKQYVIPLLMYKRQQQWFELVDDLKSSRIWSDTQQIGLDTNSYENIYKVYPHPITAIKCDVPPVLDIKSKTNIHAFDKFSCYPVSQLNKHQILKEYGYDLEDLELLKTLK